MLYSFLAELSNIWCFSYLFEGVKHMKKLIKSNADSFEFNLNKIISIAVVDDVMSYHPRDYEIFASKQIDYSTLTHEQLLQLPKRERENIHDINILRKLDKNELTFMQQREVTLANQENFQSSIKEIRNFLNKLEDCPSIYVIPTSKNNSFRETIWEMGGKLTDEDVRTIISQLKVKDYSHSTYSYLDHNWNCVLMVFEYSGEYIFSPRHKGDDPIRAESLDLYIKIDTETTRGNGYVALSFHNPEFGLSHPYDDYTADID